MKKFIILACLILFSSANAQWFWQNPLPQGNHLTTICFTDENEGWTVGTNGTILHTTDGGSIWETQNSGSDEYLLSCFFINSNTGWAVGSNGIVIKTTNGGVNWFPQYSGISNSLSSVYFTDSNNGWVVGGDIIDSSATILAYYRWWNKLTSSVE